MQGIIVQFRRGRHTIHEKHYLLDIGLDSREAAKKTIGKAVVWTSSGGKKIKGRISDAHGNKGLVRAIFEKGLPGQAMTSGVEVIADLPAKGIEKKEQKKEEKKEETELTNKEEKKDK